MAVELRFASRGPAGDPRCTEITAELPAKHALAILVRRHARHDRGEIDRGEMVDLVLGDPVFDDAFLVEAAPADVVKLLLDPPIRAQLASERAAVLSTRQLDGRMVLQLEIQRWLETSSEALRMIEAVARVASRVPEAYAAADAAAPPGEAGSPYRHNTAPQLDRERARREEFIAVRAVRGKRSRLRLRLPWRS